MSKLRKALQQEIRDRRANITRCRKIWASSTLVLEQNIEKEEKEIEEEEKMLRKLEK